MTDAADIVNLALQVLGTRTTVTTAELTAESSNEAIQANLLIDRTRDRILRMAPWNCGRLINTLTYITSAPGTPENPTQGTTAWQRGLPSPPWLYEYQYPVDCLRPCWIVPQFTTGFAGDVPITPVVMGGPPTYWTGPPVKYSVGIDKFYAATAATKVAGGSGYAVGDQITLETPAAGDTPAGAPAVLEVATLSGSAVATVTAVTNVFGETRSGSYFSRPSGTQAQDSTTGSGSGATFTLTLASQSDQRVIFTNQESAVLAYIRRVTDYNVMDELFIDGWSKYLGAHLCMALTGDKGLANGAIVQANDAIKQARTADGNEGLTIIDPTPDWLRIRGVCWPSPDMNPWSTFAWGDLFPNFG